jgi:hypothetical protein
MYWHSLSGFIFPVLRIGLPIAILVASLASCTTFPVFSSPNDFRHMLGTLYLANGDSIKGTLDINSHRFGGKPVTIHTEKMEKPLQFYKHEIASYRIFHDHYELKATGGGEYRFMKRLTGENSKIHLYENLVKEGPSGKGGYTRHRTDYYIRFAHESHAVPLKSSRYLPGFEKKMSRALRHCPELAAKIQKKERGYVYSESSLFKDDRENVLLHIIEEYNRCE